MIVAPSTLKLAAVVLAQLSTAQVTVRFEGDSAIVDAVYEIADSGTQYFTMRKFLGQGARFSVSTPAIARADVRDPSGITIELPADTLHRIQYRLTGLLDRVPILVPRTPTDPGRSRVEIRVIGASGDMSLGGGFPRFRREPDGSLVATLENVPSLVRLERRGAWTVVKAAEVLVVVLVVVSTVWWLGRRRRLASRSSTDDLPPTLEV